MKDITLMPNTWGGSCCSGSSSSATGSCCESGAAKEHSKTESCPLCGQRGQKVPTTAVENLLKPEYLSQLDNQKAYWLCPNSNCDTVYFQAQGKQVFGQEALRVKVWLKDQGDDVPLCYCHKVTRGQIKKAWRKGAKTFAEVLKETGASKGGCRCQYENPAGRCCSGAIQNYLDELAQSEQPETKENSSIVIEFMYLDLDECSRCRETDNNLDEALSEVVKVLQAAGREVSVQKIHVQSEEQARELGFVSSPTIRINGRDIQLAVKESECATCGDISGEKVDCRVWTYRGKDYDAPPKGMIIDAILRHVYGGPQETLAVQEQQVEVPNNLKKFFAGKAKKELQEG